MPLPFDPYDLDLEPMPPTFECGAFTCGDASIDDALRGPFRVSLAEGRNRGYCLTYHGQLVAFASLRAATFELDSIDRDQLTLSHREVSGIRVELFAVAKAYQGFSVGKRVMQELTAIAQEASGLVGARFLAVESVATAQAFYKRLSFLPTLVQSKESRTAQTVFMLFDLKQ